MDILGRTRVFKNEFNGKAVYSTSISSKDVNGEWQKVYVPIQFKQGMETEGDIDITKGFISMFKDKNGLGKLKFVVMEYMKVEGWQPESPVMAGDFENDLPF